MNKSLLIIPLCSLLFSPACNNSNAVTEKSPEKAINTHNPELPVVTVAIARDTVFKKEIHSNGKLQAVKKADLRFKLNEPVHKIYFRNGDNVKTGEILAELDNSMYFNQLEQARHNLDKAELVYKNLSIEYGLGSDSVKNEKITNIIKIKSGLNAAETELKTAKLNLSYTKLKAPFSGIIGNLFIKEGSMVSSADVFCMLMDNTAFEADFYIHETDIKQIRTGQQVKIIPYATDTLVFYGNIIQVNPVVNNAGLISIKARTNNRDNILMDGMNVKIIVEKDLPNRIVIPKEAVVVRSEKNVVFLYKGGIAKWKYINIEEENAQQVSVSGKINANDSVIISGNTNLAHDAKVQLKTQ